MGKIYLYQRGRARSAEAPGAPRSARRRAYRRIAPCLARGDRERGRRSSRLRRTASSRVAGIAVSREELGLGEVRHTYRARRDLIELWLAVRDVNPSAADELYKRLGARIQILEQFPEPVPRSRPTQAAAQPGSPGFSPSPLLSSPTDLSPIGRRL